MENKPGLSGALPASAELLPLLPALLRLDEELAQNAARQGAGY